jgi:hypothetical protein
MARDHQKQLGVLLPPELRARLETAATEAGHSIAEEIRQRVERTFEKDDFDYRRPDIGLLSNRIVIMMMMAERLTGRRWNEHPAVTQALKLAIGSVLQHHGADDTATFKREDWPTDRLGIGTEDPKVIAVSLETFSDAENVTRLNDLHRQFDRSKREGKE